MISETVKKQNKTLRKFWNRMLLLARVKVCKYLFFMRKKYQAVVIENTQAIQI